MISQSKGVCYFFHTHDQLLGDPYQFRGSLYSRNTLTYETEFILFIFFSIYQIYMCGREHKLFVDLAWF